jgi:hypothetical protein
MDDTDFDPDVVFNLPPVSVRHMQMVDQATWENIERVLAAARAVADDWQPFTDDAGTVVTAPPFIRALQKALANYDNKPAWL